jgi:Holliday junction DNA helicase RuvA
MIGWLCGVVRRREPAGLVILDVGGVGYQLAVSLQALAAVPEVGAACELWVHTHVREDALDLYGFASLEERQVFHLLLSVPGVGPKLATAILGGLPLRELMAAVAAGDRGALQRIPGVGKKTAERLILDVAEKVAVLIAGRAGALPDAVSPAAGASGSGREEARAMLTALGWKPRDVEREVEAVYEADGALPLDEIVRRALARLMGARR